MISKAALNVLEWLSAGCDDEYGYPRELVIARKVCMRGVHRLPLKVAQELITWCCVKPDCFDRLGSDMEHWTITGTGRAMLKDPVGTCQHIAALLRGDIRE